MNDMLNGALVSGTGKRAAIPLHAAAGKTGTTQSFRDAWFIGYTAHLTTGVWAGNDDGSAMNRVVGGSLPAEIWRDIMLGAHAGRQPLPLSGAAPASTVYVPPEPVYPQERIADDFIARAIGAGAADTGSIDGLMAR
jgi:penicillin-binding protein 1A